jgi:hypothetical protein
MMNDECRMQAGGLLVFHSELFVLHFLRLSLGKDFCRKLPMLR